jgi:hypothetical protein
VTKPQPGFDPNALMPSGSGSAPIPGLPGMPGLPGGTPGGGTTR